MLSINVCVIKNNPKDRKLRGIVYRSGNLKQHLITNLALAHFKLLDPARGVRLGGFF